jgi:Flagellar motor switch protein
MTDVDLEAVIDTQIMKLADVFDLKVGSQIMLSTSSQDVIELHCGEVPMYTGRMGRKGQNIAIRIEDRIDRLPKV